MFTENVKTELYYNSESFKSFVNFNVNITKNTIKRFFFYIYKTYLITFKPNMNNT